MSSEEYQLLRKSVREFGQKNIEGVAAKIEKEGLRQETVMGMAAQGFVGARIPSELGGAGLDEHGYLIVLEELARISPSAAVKVLITNSLYLPLVLAAKKGEESLQDAASAKINVTVAHAGLLEGHSAKPGVTVADSRARGEEEHVLNSDANLIILAATGAPGPLLLVKGGFEPLSDHLRLGFRGLRFSSIKVDSGDFVVLGENGLGAIEAALNEMDLEVAAVALGITSGALTKAIDYSKARTTFEHPLKDYQPVAFALSSLRSEEEMLRSFIYAEGLSSTAKMMARMKSTELARRATAQALQVHGGYGYFGDFGVEKFYRDAMALPLLFTRGVKDMERLSEAVFESKAGFL
ncbi:MAG TPA: acyl-CoA dehydrogenase family protein [Nitrososphaerales archaeon]|nr:acyl-CoA dehydrogenase family protein [Nitrososphaerales archaeon]